MPPDQNGRIPRDWVRLTGKRVPSTGAASILGGMKGHQPGTKQGTGQSFWAGRKRWVASALLLGALGCQSTGPDGRASQEASEILEQADRVFEAGAFQEAVELYKLASVAARTEKDEPRFVEAAAQVASSYSLLGQPQEGSSWLAQARDAEVDRDDPAFGRVLLASALRSRDAGDAAAAESKLLGLYEWSMEQGRHAWAMQASTMGSVVATPTARIAWCERGLQAARASEERAWIAAAYQSLGYAHEEAADYETAVVELRKARDLTRAGTRERLRADWALAHNLRLAGRPDDAAEILLRAIPAAKAFHARGFAVRDAEWLGRCHEEWAEVLVGRGQWRNALRAFQSARQAYLLADIQDLAPRKWQEFEARIAQVKLMRVRARKAPEGQAQPQDR